MTSASTPHLFRNSKVWFKPIEAARFLSRSRKFIQRHTKPGDLAAHLLVGTDECRYHRSDLEAYLTKMRRR